MAKKGKIDKIKSQQEKIKSEQDNKLKKLRQKIEREVDYTLDGSVKQLFLNLTKMQIPFDYENTLEKFFPKGLKTDAHGNYYIKIGKTKTIFCAHLDTYCYEYKRVWHVIEGNKIKTDGTTTLGGDDKAGVVILIKMIEARVPGLYLFFRGEEGVTSPTGTWGSQQAIKTYKDNFKKYDRCIAFDRRDINSVISQQMYSECCSPSFVNALITDLKNNGLNYKDDPTGMWCDSGVFMEIIPECTNLSVGYDDEHTFKESQDIDHLEKLVEACIKINWETLPTERDPSKVSYGVDNYNYDYNYEWDYQYGGRKIKHKGGPREFVTMDEEFIHVIDILKRIGYESLNNEFKEAEEMYFQNYETGDFFGLRIIDFDIYMSEDDSLKKYEYLGDLDTFEKYVSINNDEDSTAHLNSISRETSTGEIAFTTKQENIFKKFVKNNTPLVEDIMVEIRGKNKIQITNDTWLDLEGAMIASNLELNYDDGGINPDDFVEWIGYNWEWCLDEINDENNDDIDDDKTLSTLDAIFYDIALNQHQQRKEIEQFIFQVINKNLVNDFEGMDKYQSILDGWLNQKYKTELKKDIINHRKFIIWLDKHQKDLLTYYEE